MGKNPAWWGICEAWHASGGHLRQGAPIHFKVHEWPILVTPNQEKHLDSVPPSNGWTDRMSQPGDQNIPPNLHQSPTNWLGRIVGTSCLPTQQPSTLRHQEDSLLHQLWKEPWHSSQPKETVTIRQSSSWRLRCHNAKNSRWNQTFIEKGGRADEKTI